MSPSSSIAHSSNPGAPDFQEIPTPRGPLWLAVCAEVRRFASANGNAGVVVGATYADAIRLARQTLGNGVPILVPGEIITREILDYLHKMIELNATVDGLNENNTLICTIKKP